MRCDCRTCTEAAKKYGGINSVVRGDVGLETAKEIRPPQRKRRSNTHAARDRRQCARRAVYAMLQDEEIRFDVIDDLAQRVDRAVAIAMTTKTEQSAIVLAALNRTKRLVRERAR